METLSAYSLPPGFGFHPTDVELLSHYLKRKILGLKNEFEVIQEVDIYKHEPWDLPAKSHIPTRDCKWHFFSCRDRKYPNGSRSNRATEAGYWKSTGKDRNIRFQNHVIGTKKTLVFHKGRPPSGKRTDWIMHEYYLNENECKVTPGMKDIFVLCRVTKRNGLEPEGNEASSTSVEKSDNPCVPLTHRGSKQLEDISALPTQKKESSSPSENVEELEAWLQELYDPSFCTTPTFSELMSEIKVEPCSFAPKQEPVDTSFSPDVVEGPHPSLRKGDDLDENWDNQYNTLEFNSNLFAELDFEGIDDASTHLFNAEEVLDCLFPQELAVGIPQGDINETGIQIRERLSRAPNDLSNQRIRLQVHKMESQNRGSVNQTLVFVSKDHHVNSNDEFSESSKPFRRTTTSNQAKTEVQGKCTFGESSLAPASYQSITKYEESCMSEDSQTEVLSCQAESEPGKPLTSKASNLLLRRLLVPSSTSRHSSTCCDNTSLVRRVIRGVGLFIRRCSSAGLNCLFLVTCMMGTAALIAYFLLRDARRFLNNASSLGL